MASIEQVRFLLEIPIVSHHLNSTAMMKYLQLSLMGLTLALSPIACFANNWFVAGTLCNIAVLMAAMYLTFDDTTSKQPEARFLSILMWGSLLVQLSYSFFL